MVHFYSSGTWHTPGEPYNPKKVHEDVVYSEEDDKAIDEWVAGKWIWMYSFEMMLS